MKKTFLIFLIIPILIFAASCAPDDKVPDYSEISNWAYLQKGADETFCDVFFVCPTVYSGDDKKFNMPLNDDEIKADFIGAINMEKGIYSENARFFSPYYRQAALAVYEMNAEEREKYLNIAFNDILAAFDYYINNLNGGRPVILAGFSQGADMCIRLMKERFNNPEIRNKLIACYAIGWSITAEEISEYPHLKFAGCSDDTGVIISFNSEAPHVESSVIVPEGIKTLAINPLNWRTDGSLADKSLNLGACFTDYDGAVADEIDNFTSAYIDGERGTLKVPDVNESDYPPMLDIFDSGVYHVYDYQFFYSNLKDNVSERTRAYTARQLSEAA